MSEANSRATVKRYGTLEPRLVEIVGADERSNTELLLSLALMSNELLDFMLACRIRFLPTIISRYVIPITIHCPNSSLVPCIIYIIQSSFSLAMNKHSTMWACRSRLHLLAPQQSLLCKVLV